MHVCVGLRVRACVGGCMYVWVCVCVCTRGCVRVGTVPMNFDHVSMSTAVPLSDHTAAYHSGYDALVKGDLLAARQWLGQRVLQGSDGQGAWDSDAIALARPWSATRDTNISFLWSDIRFTSF